LEIKCLSCDFFVFKLLCPGSLFLRRNDLNVRPGDFHLRMFPTKGILQFCPSLLAILHLAARHKVYKTMLKPRQITQSSLSHSLSTAYHPSRTLSSPIGTASRDEPFFGKIMITQSPLVLLNYLSTPLLQTLSSNPMLSNPVVKFLKARHITAFSGPFATIMVATS
jgi:hypothetical protein